MRHPAGTVGFELGSCVLSYKYLSKISPFHRISGGEGEGVDKRSTTIALTPALSLRETTARMQSVENVGNRFSRGMNFES